MTPLFLSAAATRGFPTCAKIYGNSLFAPFKSFRIILLPPLLLPPRANVLCLRLAPRPLAATPIPSPGSSPLSALRIRPFSFPSAARLIPLSRARALAPRLR